MRVAPVYPWPFRDMLSSDVNILVCYLPSVSSTGALGTNGSTAAVGAGGGYRLVVITAWYDGGADAMGLSTGTVFDFAPVPGRSRATL